MVSAGNLLLRGCNCSHSSEQGQCGQQPGKLKPLVPFLSHVLLLNQTLSKGKVFKSGIYSTGVQLWVSPQGVIHAEKRLIFIQQMQIHPEGEYRQDRTRLFSERLKEDARGSSHDLKHEKLIIKQEAGLDTANNPFHSRFFCDSWVFCFDDDKIKILAGKLQLLIEW